MSRTKLFGMALGILVVTRLAFSVDNPYFGIFHSVSGSLDYIKINDNNSFTFPIDGTKTTEYIMAALVASTNCTNLYTPTAAKVFDLDGTTLIGVEFLRTGSQSAIRLSIAKKYNSTTSSYETEIKYKIGNNAPKIIRLKYNEDEDKQRANDFAVATLIAGFMNTTNNIGSNIVINVYDDPDCYIFDVTAKTTN